MRQPKIRKKRERARIEREQRELESFCAATDLYLCEQDIRIEEDD